MRKKNVGLLNPFNEICYVVVELQLKIYDQLIE
jgi:hypothetical protein